MPTRIDHRPRVAAQRRDAMRARLLETILTLAVRDSSARPSIDEVLADSGASRGTFYKYFDSVPGLMSALATNVAHELAGIFDPLVTQSPDPAVRISCGARLCLRLVGRHAALCNLLIQTGWPDDRSHPIFVVLTRDLESGIRLGRFPEVSLPVALNLVVGCLLGGIHSMRGEASKTYPDEVAFCVLRGLGVQAEEAQSIAKMRLVNPKIPSSSIVARLIGAHTASSAMTAGTGSKLT